MHVICGDCTEFQDKILLREGECETSRKSNFLKNGKMVILVKIQNFISHDETNITVGIVSRNLATMSNFVKFRDSQNFTFFETRRGVRDT